MALICVEGFDHFTQITEKGWVGGSGLTYITPGRDGSGQAVRIVPFNQIRKQLPGSYDTLFVGCGFRLHLPAHYMMSILASGALAARIGVSPDMRVVLEDSSGTVVGTGTTILTEGQWFQVEVKIAVAAGVGEVHLNGLPEIASTSGIDFGGANLTQVELGQETGLFDGNLDADDLYVCDTSGSSPQNTFLGDMTVRTLYPHGDGTYTDWIPDSGSQHYPRVDETLIDGDASYVHSNNPTDKDSYSMQTIAVGASIVGAQLNLGAKKNEAGARAIKPLVRESGVDYLGDEHGLTTDYLFYSWQLGKDPSGAAWTVSSLNSAEYGVELTV